MYSSQVHAMPKLLTAFLTLSDPIISKDKRPFDIFMTSLLRNKCQGMGFGLYVMYN